MVKHVVGFFCGTNVKKTKEKSFQLLINQITLALKNIEIFDYDGPGFQATKFMDLEGMTAHGTSETAKKFVDALKKVVQDNPDEPIKINLVAHSRGCIAALKAVKKIQADPDLRNRVEIVLDLRDPVPGNLSVTLDVGYAEAVGVKIADLSDCSVVKKAHVTLTTQGMEAIVGNLIDDAGYRPIIPKFSPATETEIEVLNADHVQLEEGNATAQSKLANTKSEQLIYEHAGVLDQRLFSDPKEEQIALYKDIQEVGEEVDSTRKIHYGGSITVNQGGKYLNARHQQLEDPDSEPNYMLGINAPNNLSFGQKLFLGSIKDEGRIKDYKFIMKIDAEINAEIDKLDKNLGNSARALKDFFLVNLMQKFDAAALHNKPFNYDGDYNYRRLYELNAALQQLNNPQADQKAKVDAVKRFEDCAQKDVKNWSIYETPVTNFIVSALEHLSNMRVVKVALNFFKQIKQEKEATTEFVEQATKPRGP